MSVPAPVPGTAPSSRRAWRWIALLAAFAVLFVSPVVVLGLRAVAARWSYPHLLPEAYSLRALELLVRDGGGLARSLVSSTVYSSVTVLLAFAVSVLPASVLARYEFRGRLAVEALLLSPVLVPAITYGIGLHFLMIRVGLANTTAGVVLVLTAASYPYMLRSLTAGFQQIHPDFDRCATNLGASLHRRVLTVHLPLLGPAVVAGGSVVFLVAFSEYFLVFLVGGGVVPSYTGYLFPYVSGGDWTIGAGLTLGFVVVPLVLFVAIDRTLALYYRRRGMTGIQ